MIRVFAYVYRLAAGLLLGAQVYFAMVAAPAAFPREVAALPAGSPARAAAVPVLLTGLCALASSEWVTPRIHALRAAGQTQLPEFGRLHAVSTALLGVEIVLLLVALWVAPAPAKG
jgi:hypothetical protein